MNSYSTSWWSWLLIYRPREDERLSWPCWLTYSGRFTHIRHISFTTSSLNTLGSFVFEQTDKQTDLKILPTPTDIVGVGNDQFTSVSVAAVVTSLWIVSSAVPTPSPIYRPCWSNRLTGSFTTFGGNGPPLTIYKSRSVITPGYQLSITVTSTFVYDLQIRGAPKFGWGRTLAEYSAKGFGSTTLQHSAELR